METYQWPASQETVAPRIFTASQSTCLRWFRFFVTAVAFPCSTKGEFIIGEIKRVVGRAFLLVPGVLGSACKEIVVGAFEVIEGPFHHTLGHLIGPRILLLPDLIEPRLQRERIGRREHALL